MNQEVEILIVEDSPTQAFQLKHTLKRHGYHVKIAGNGQEALALLRAEEPKPTLVISDIMMPEMDGYELCSRIKADDELKRIPVILLTSLSDSHDVLQGLESGADNFVTKPYEESHLISRIQYILVNRELRHTQAINIQLGVELFFAGKRRFVTAEQQQVLDLLLGTYEAAVEKNKALIKTQEELRELNESLEKRVEERTAELRAEITERQRIEEERTHLLVREQKARAEAEAAGRAKDEFLATVSHELRTPLTSIFGWTRLIRSGKLDEPNVSRALETIERNANLQTQIVDDLLDVSRIITGNLRLAVSAVNLSTIIETTINALRPAAEAKSIQIETTLDASAGRVAGDEQRLQQVVWNLLSNAIKFTPESGRIKMRLERFDHHVQLSVSDTGIGIKPEFLPYVFERFRQADGSTTRAYGGLGLGLAIVRHLVELHGGTVHAESLGEGQGSIFTVQLRQWIERDENSTTSVERPSQSPREKRGGLRLSCPPELNELRILLVDDNQDALELWSAVLKQCGAEILAVTSVRAALNAFDDWKPDVLISDIGMSGESGYDLIRMVRAREAERGGRVPALALTGYAREEDRIEALRAGFHKHIVKPVNPDELIATVAGLSA